ncbi:hypothetical protein BC938DRAFT_474394 [Jimgerdemannia flammicorona]|uniref:N-acetyltransferase domain-containing protein n=1 Tax=Jimgerdemannia flammicorona TaxID=994334 RepID=A0A433QZG4_9FUNG|nr:hypothetical protein BC938DRAFT_474394 [Jimgerdemannia flammicorona]
MRANENLILVCTCRPPLFFEKPKMLCYRCVHKKTFLHSDWQQGHPEMTASEPLTLEEEFEMQRTWHTDDDKCTFIVLARPPNLATDELTVSAIKAHAKMIGDVNLFLNHPDDDRSFAEIEIMIAEEAYRRGGRGSEALKIMMGYALTRLDIATFQAKISYTNMPSVDLFTRGLGFTQISESEVFQERTFEWSLKVPEEGEKVKEVRDEVLRGWGQVVQRRWDE